jgi:hypothetical protein
LIVATAAAKPAAVASRAAVATAAGDINPTNAPVRRRSRIKNVDEATDGSCRTAAGAVFYCAES